MTIYQTFKKTLDFKLICLVFVIISYSLIFKTVYNVAGNGAFIFMNLFPVAGGLLFGMRGGFITGASVISLLIFLGSTLHLDFKESLPMITMSSILMLSFGSGVGRLRDLSLEAKKELQRRIELEKQLRKSQAELESRVEERTLQLKQQAIELKNSEEKYKALVRYAPTGICEFDMKELRFTNVNDIMCDYTGYNEKEFLCLDPYEIICEQSHNTFNKLIDEVYANQPEQVSVEYKIKSKNQKEFWVLANARLSYEDNVPVKVMAVMHDLTEIRKAEDDRRRLEIELQQSRKMEAIGTLAGGIAHDFNNILSGIFGYSQLALSRIDNPQKVKDCITQIDKGSKRAAELVRQILTFSRRDVYQKHPLQISDAIKEAVQLLRSSIPATIEIKKRIVSNSFILADPIKIHQLLINLCTNSYHAIGESTGSIIISLTDKKIQKPEGKKSTRILPGDYIELEVTDTGCGMNDSILEKIFDPYFSTKPVGQGTGLGLALVNAIVKEHEGFIAVKSRSGRGTSFFVRFPVFEKKAARAPSVSNKATCLNGDERIMFVDDEEALRNISKEILSNHGYSVAVFKNGFDAFLEFENDPYKYDLVITDMTMPKMSGEKLAKKILKINPDIPVLICTGFSETLSKEDVSSIGIKKILNKPLAINDLIENIREIFDEESKHMKPN